VLEVVNDQQQLAAGQILVQRRLELELGSRHGHALHPCRRDATSVGYRGQGDQEDAVGEGVADGGSAGDGQARLPRATRADQGDQALRGLGQAAREVGQLGLPAQERGGDRRQVGAGRLERPGGGELRAAPPRDHEVKQGPRGGEVLEGVLAEILHVGVGHEGSGRRAEQDLPAVRGRAEPRGVVNVDPPVGAVVLLGLAGVKRDPDADRTAVRLGVTGQGMLGAGRRRHRR
jgi:hypothetical protein